MHLEFRALKEIKEQNECFSRAWDKMVCRRKTSAFFSSFELIAYWQTKSYTVVGMMQSYTIDCVILGIARRLDPDVFDSETGFCIAIGKLMDQVKRLKRPLPTDETIAQRTDETSNPTWE